MEITRETYFKKKRIYRLILTTLRVFRFFSLTLLTVFLVYLTIYSLNQTKGTNNEPFFYELVKYTRIIIPLDIIIWIALKVIHDLVRRNLRKIKGIAGVIDEVWKQIVN